MHRTLRILPGLLALTAVLACAGCMSQDGVGGYTAASLYRPGIRTVACPIWTRGKDVYRRDIEVQLTKAIVDRINLSSDYKVTSRGQANTLLTGSIDGITQKTLSFNPDTGDPREMQVAYILSFRWEDLRTGEVLVERRGFVVASTYLPSAPYNERFFRGTQDALDEIARRVVEQMESDWGGGA